MQTTINQNRIAETLRTLFEDSKNDRFKMLKGVSKGIFRPLQPADFKDVYLSISKEQGEALCDLIQENHLKHIVEFGTSFGISTLYLAQAIIETGGSIITTELLESKAQRAQENFDKAGVGDVIELRVGDAMKTLSNHQAPIDFLLLDGWKDLYLPLFEMLESNFHRDSIIYVDNADMDGSQILLRTVAAKSNYHIEYQFHGKVAIIRCNHSSKNEII